MSRKLNFLKVITFSFILVLLSVFSSFSNMNTYAADDFTFIILSTYEKTLDIGDEFYLTAFTSNGKKPKFSSGNSKVASVNTYGKITAKKNGTAKITVKTTNAEASCKITVRKTTIKLNQTSLTMDNGYTAYLRATVSTGHDVTWKSSKKSVATIDENGVVRAQKPGTTTITAKADNTTVSCKVTVRKPVVELYSTSVSLFRTQKLRLRYSSTSRSSAKWKSNKKSVATVDETGTVTAIKNGTARITVTVDGVSKTCSVKVKKPTIKFSPNKVSLTVGESYTPKVTVSSGIKPEYSSSNMNVASVDEYGCILARQKGKAYIYAKEDGAKASLIVTVK